MPAVQWIQKVTNILLTSNHRLFVAGERNSIEKERTCKTERKESVGSRVYVREREGDEETKRENDGVRKKPYAHDMRSKAHITQALTYLWPEQCCHRLLLCYRQT